MGGGGRGREVEARNRLNNMAAMLVKVVTVHDFNARYIFLDNIAYVRILKYGEQTCGKILRKSF